MVNFAGRSVLVTGGTGFVGSRLVRQLVEEKCQVHLIVRPSSGMLQLKDVKGQIDVHRHDGSMEGLTDILAVSSPEVVFHLASLFISEHQSKDIRPMIESNLLFATQLLEAMTAANVTKLVNTGTSWQHYHNQNYNPVNLYAATKQAFEDILKYYLEATNMRAISLKLFDTYGPDDPRTKLIHLLKRIAESGETLAMSQGEQLVDLVHVDDVVEAFVLAGKYLVSGLDEKHECYAVSSCNPLPLKDLVGVLEGLLGKKLDIKWGKRPYRDREVMTPWNTGSPLPGWESKITLFDGLRSLFAWEGG